MHNKLWLLAFAPLFFACNSNNLTPELPQPEHKLVLTKSGWQLSISPAQEQQLTSLCISESPEPPEVCPDARLFLENQGQHRYLITENTMQDQGWADLDKLHYVHVILRQDPQPELLTFSNRYQTTGDEQIVHDRLTQLSWQRCSPGQQWSSQLERCQGNALKALHPDDFSTVLDSLNANSAIEWRVANINELYTLIQCRGEPAKQGRRLAFHNLLRVRKYL